ncbi:uncharacterized protein LACBIDRAFT_324499 [Laccaria bicolor S238N-H82]|uniref:Predicted protein n=1 Tax=Laccaria bicolor (strain S238N-H82 / ATCC MYA-4686) TaxID=486041 RepID=B0D206_LACBS|nr:uncharacterized protein LACBIDRAFT_324499 [Laccaria bicolor S238N-H82]EDR11735.1 predicted protein [Laccaria bicolor S238N-H82]|eukprot:XP_001877632.1 predicted protein [Laccaria bicolor S238N-H82]
MAQCLDNFHQYKDIFIELEACSPGHFNILKIHSMQHYVALIRMFGSTDSFHIESPEQLHIDYAKNACRASNKKDYTVQMTIWLRRREAIDRFTLYLNWARNGSYKIDKDTSHPPPTSSTRDTNDDGGDDDKAIIISKAAPTSASIPSPAVNAYSVALHHPAALQGIQVPRASTSSNASRSFFKKSLKPALTVLKTSFEQHHLFPHVAVNQLKVHIWTSLSYALGNGMRKLKAHRFKISTQCRFEIVMVLTDEDASLGNVGNLILRADVG